MAKKAATNKSTRLCSIDGCDVVHYGKGFCNKHYQRVRDGANPREKNLRDLTTTEKFEMKFKKGDGCWLWLAGKDQDGYGLFTTNRVMCKAHRFSYSLYRGPISEGLFVLHKCDVPSCVNPDHLFLGTNQDNMTDMVKKGRGHHGEKNWSAKLKAEEVIKIRGLYPEKTQAAISDMFGVGRTTVRAILTRRTWRHI